MTRARSQLIDLDNTSYYHCISRCVRRAFLWGEDHFTGKNYAHRKQWVLDRLAELNNIFAIDICAYAIMSNHYHLVLRIDADKAEAWPEDEVMARWSKLFSLPILVARYQSGKTSAAESLEAQKIITTWRERLKDISWFMRSLNEHLARKANQEDNCKGRFWEGRFKSQALLDEAAVLTCMSYVDLNPIRAGIARLPEDSDFTSIQQRLKAYQKSMKDDMTKDSKPQVPLLAFNQNTDKHKHAFAYEEIDYLELVDWAGRAIREGKRGFIAAEAPIILHRLGIAPSQYLKHVDKQAKKLSCSTAIGCKKKLKAFAKKIGQQYVKGTPIAI